MGIEDTVQLAHLVFGETITQRQAAQRLSVTDRVELQSPPKARVTRDEQGLTRENRGGVFNVVGFHQLLDRCAKYL